MDVSLDGGRSWVQADLDEQVSPWTWRHWRSTVDRPAGGVEITARAWDTSAAAQPEPPVHLWNPKGYVCYVNNSWAGPRPRHRPLSQPAGSVGRSGAVSRDWSR